MTTLENKHKEDDLDAYLYASDKKRLVSMVQEMADRAVDALKRAINALQHIDLALAEQVIADDYIDEMEEQIDQECLYSIAMRQPMREDLRFVYAVMKIITDIERIGDQAVNVALRLKKLAQIPGVNVCPMLAMITEMAHEDVVMLGEAMDAFVKEDGEVVSVIRTRRKRVHRIRDAAVEELLRNSAPAHPSDITTGELFVSMWILRHLSRISDHALNLAEKVAFIATGVSPLTLKKNNQKTAREAETAEENNIGI